MDVSYNEEQQFALGKEAHMSRRGFMQTSALAALGVTLAGTSLAVQGEPAFGATEEEVSENGSGYQYYPEQVEGE